MTPTEVRVITHLIATSDEDRLYTMYLAWHNAPEWDWMRPLIDARAVELGLEATP